MLDNFSRFVESACQSTIPDKSTKTVASAICYKWIKPFGTPILFNLNRIFIGWFFLKFFPA